jgi:hypothetical protein
MNDQQPSTTPRTNVEDNYPEYLEHEFGYAYEVDDVMSQAAIARHQTLLHADAAELEDTDVDGLDDFQRWAVARAWRRLGKTERYVDGCRALLETDNAHPVIIYSEISRGLAHHLIDADRLDEARQILDEHFEHWASDVQARQLAAIIDLLEADNEAALEELCADYPDDAELRFEIAEDLWRFGRVEAARRWLERAGEVARSSGDHAALVDIELLGDRLAEAPGADDLSDDELPSEQ